MFKEMAIIAGLAAAIAAPAYAQPGGSSYSVSVGRDLKADAQNKGAVTCVAIGQGVSCRISQASMTSTKVGRDATLTVKNDSAVTGVAIGQGASAVIEQASMGK